MALRVSDEALRLEEDLQAASRRAVHEHQSLFTETEKRWISEAAQPKPVPTAAKKTSWNDKIAKMRIEYPNAYKSWSDADDARLIKLHGEGLKTKKLTEAFGRHPGSIRARLKKLLETE